MVIRRQSESRARTAWFYWWSSLIWAVPITFVLCVAGTGMTLTIAYATGGDEHSASEYVSTALVGFFLWGTVVFVGTCRFLIPLVTSLTALVRYLYRNIGPGGRDYRPLDDIAR
ncbi:hypothetical protein HQO90_19410 [Rhodococcus fascians]|nr:hypothetical protein [Rhodococcus fascians]